MRTLLGALCLMLLVFAMGTPASAVEVNVKGEYRFAFTVIDNGNFYDHGWDNQSEDQFHARQRTRVQIDFVASENLKGVFIAEIGEMQWGRPGTGRSRGAALGADAVNIETKRLMIEFNIPNTDLRLRVGVQGLELPNIGYGNALFKDDVAGIVASYKFNDMVAMTAFWARLYDLQGNNITSPSSPLFDEMDFFGLMVPIEGDGWAMTPYAAFLAMGRDVTPAQSGSLPFLLSPAHYAGLMYGGAPFINQYINDSTNLYGWWVGTTFELDMYDPFGFKFEGLYGSVEAESNALDRRGFYLAAELDYELDFVTISLLGWYASGEDGSWTNGSEQLPSVSLDEGFAPTSFGFDGSDIIPRDGIVSQTAAGKAGLRLGFLDMSFIDDLEHHLRFLIAVGTNHPNSRRIIGLVQPNLILGYKNTYNAAFVVPPGSFTLPGPTPVPGIDLTTEDLMFEVNFDHFYKLYENLELALELGMVHVQYGNDLWVHADTSTAWKASLGLKYKF